MNSAFNTLVASPSTMNSALNTLLASLFVQRLQLCRLPWEDGPKSCISPSLLINSPLNCVWNLILCFFSDVSGLIHFVVFLYRKQPEDFLQQALS